MLSRCSMRKPLLDGGREMNNLGVLFRVLRIELNQKLGLEKKGKKCSVVSLWRRME